MHRGKLVKEIAELKDRRRAIVLAHNYQIAEVEEIVDFTGDSLELSRKAAGTDAEAIVFCGVLFMAETAAILSPEKEFYLPKKEVVCQDMKLTSLSRVRDALREMKYEIKVPGEIRERAERAIRRMIEIR